MSAATPRKTGIRGEPATAAPWEFHGQITFAEKAMVEMLDAGNGRLGPLLEEMARTPDGPAAAGKAQEASPAQAIPRRSISAWLCLPWRR